MKTLGYLIIVVLLTANVLLFAQTIVETEANQQRIFIRFNKTMNKSVDLWSSIQIQPSACGNWKWLSDSELVFIADSLFADNTIYIVTLSPHMISSEGEALSPCSFYFINESNAYNLYRVPFQWEDVEYPDVEVDWNGGYAKYTLRSRYWLNDTTKTYPKNRLDFLWQKTFYGPLRNWEEKPTIKFDLDVTGNRLVVIKGGEEIWQRKLNWLQCMLACTNNYVSYVAAFGQTGEGQGLYIFDTQVKTLWKYPLFNCNLMDFSSSGAYLTVALLSNDMYLFNVPQGKILWHKKLPDSNRITSIAVSNNGEIVVVFDKKSTDTIPFISSSKLLLYDRKGDVIWQGDFQSYSTKVPEIAFTDIGEYFIIYNDNKLYCFRMIRGVE